MDLRLTQLAETNRASAQAKEAVQAPAPTASDGPSVPVTSGFDLGAFAEVTSLSGRYVLFALAVTCLNKKNLNMEELFDDDQYRYGFLVAVASMDLFKGESDYDGVSVDEFPGADADFLSTLVTLNQNNAANSDVKTLPESVAVDFGTMRAYFEDHGFELY